MHLRLSWSFLPLVIPTSIIALSVWLASSVLAHQHPAVFVGITYDLIILSPLLYFLAARKTDIPKITVIPVTLLGAFVAGKILPENARVHYDILSAYYLPLLELFIFGFVGYGAWQIRQEVKENRHKGNDAFSLLQQSTKELLGESLVANVLAAELAAIYYAFFVWKKRPLQEGEFSYHKKSGAVALWLTLLFVVLVETFVLHLILAQWSALGAWILTGLSIYSGISFLAHSKALARRPHAFLENKLVLRSGIFGSAEIPYRQIEKVELCKRSLHQERKDAHKLGLLPDLEPHNIALYVCEAQCAERAYGLKRDYKVILFQVDEYGDFLNILKEKYIKK